jgi:uncharacterized membrane protein YdjX (TVP38/TMEM64 family)
VWLGALTLALLAGLTVAVWALPLVAGMSLPGFGLSVEALAAEIRSWGMWGVAASILLMVLHSFVPFPAEIVAMANGMLYGPLWGTAITWSGAMLGAYLAFGLARWLGRRFVLAMLPERQHAAIDRLATRRGGALLLLSRLLPVISFNLINYAAGLTAISWWTFSWATAIGILPLTCLMVVAGDRLWSGEAGVWLWLIVAAVASGLLWLLLRGRRPA